MSDRRSGGAYSLQADTFDLRAAAVRLDRAGDDARELQLDLLRDVAGVPAESVVLSPGSAAAVARSVAGLTVGRASLLGLSLDAELTARGLRYSSAAYEMADDFAGRVVRCAGMATAVPRTVFAAGAVVAGATYASMPMPPINDAVRDASVPDEVRNTSWTDAAGTLAGSAVSTDPGLVYDVLDIARMVAFVGGGRSLDFETQAAWALAMARTTGLLLDDRALTIRPATPGPGSRTGPAPTSVAALLREQRVIEGAPGNDSASRIRVHHVRQPDGSAGWIVQIPGTQTWDPHRPANPADAAANLAGVAGVPSSLYPAIEAALRTSMAKAGVAPGREPVMLVGHSQGGIVATRMAVDPRFRREFRVTHVVTAGSPVSRIAVPAEVTTLDLSHRTDVVPRLDGQPDPDAVNRFGIEADPAPRLGDDTDPLSVHGANRYADTASRVAAPGDLDPNIREFYVGAEPFFGRNAIPGHDEIDDYELSRPQQ